MDWQTAEREFESEVLGTETLGRMFEKSVERNANSLAQQYRGGIYDRSMAGTAFPPAPQGEYAGLSYAEMRDIVRILATGFRELGVEQGDRVGVFAQTRMEWAQTDFALLSAGAVVTTVYKSSSPEKVRYLLDDPDADGVVVENEELLERVLEVEDDLDLEFLVSMDELSRDDRDDVYTLADVYDLGEEAFDEEAYQEWVDEPDVDDLASIIYTSGTTGQPKGVKLTHRNFRANVNQVYRRVGPRPDKGEDTPTIDDDSKMVSYLPLAHVFERTAGHFLPFAAGATVAYAESSETLQEDFGAVQPTGATSVPRVYEKIYDAIREQATESPIKERIFNWATDVGKEYQRTDDPGPILEAKLSIADKLVFSQVKEALGGNIEMLVSGGGTLSPDLCTLYHGMGLPIFEGYGLTETAPVVTTNPPEEPKIGTVGPAVPGCEVKVDDTVVPDGEAADTPGETGELLVKGPNVAEGYWEKPEATDRAFTEDVPASTASGESEDSSSGRWFRTGDIVTIRPDGYVVFHERAKQLLVLSTGKNVAPAPIEDAFAAREPVEQCMVVGDGEKFVGALIVPNVDALRRLAENEGVDLPDSAEEIADHEWVRERIDEEVEAVNERFEAHETIKEYRIVPIEFTEDNDLLTPTMKKKRRAILEEFEDEVDSIYAEDETEQRQAA
ncbi:long-chain fatty acid--CoA ligase [Halobiforma lacisalsi AJ5]|uniref:AMP-dependent synthetase and ligase n=1 Tax=Natronobacterium lacisalsi AJ5 TaxID=358396 RepID=M0LJ52_NATLA|nr:long-chain fatty acid--CoA ligase [Halobiforma lacisalsi]APW96700.1 long-chain fatty acid--CoA ligase [Halobiforma lacisalsi AJ5]EMA32015.1 AMP-dependent synthetase and ligase [Halobiforma lacisalsi AJ5]